MPGPPSDSTRSGILQRLLAVVIAVLVVAAVIHVARSASPSPAPGPLRTATSPLTGLPADPDAPVLAVKVDNTPAGRPWTGVADADVVYVEPVEGGTTRLLAVFSSRLPESVGPVRSFRESDLTVLAAFGRPALAFSGAAPELAGSLASAPVIGLSPATAADAFRRDPARRPPVNLYADPARLVRAAPDAAGPRDVGYRFGPAPEGGEPTTRRRVEFPAAVVDLDWDAGRGRWLVSAGERPAVTTDGRRVGAATVLVQRVPTRASAIRDAAGAVSPYADTVGRGTAEVLRDGRTFPARWSRPSPEAGTTVTTPDGAPLPFAPGPVWVLLVPSG